MNSAIRHFSGSTVRSSKALVAAVAVAAAVSILSFASPAKANLTITPTFDSTITSDANAAAIEAGINAAIGRLEAAILNPVSVSIDFKEGGGLGESSTYISTIPYSTYVTDLQTKQTLSASDTTAIASLGAASSTNPVNGGTTVQTALPLLRAFGINASSGTFDSTITLNTSIMNVSRTGPQNSSFYDLQAVVTHEMDEVLSTGGGGSTLGDAGSEIGVLDLYRYASAGVRSFTTSNTATPYFSIDGGVTDLVHFNQLSGADYSDWGNGVSPAEAAGNTPPQVQDAFGTSGVDLNLGSNELTALDVVGWNLAAVPEPTSIALVAIGALGLARRGKRAKSI